MLRVTHDGVDVEVRFYHGLRDPGEIEGRTGKVVDEPRRCSSVMLKIDGKSVKDGLAVCHPKDNFCRSTGRKKALADALWGLPIELRKSVWEEYEKQCGF